MLYPENMAGSARKNLAAQCGSRSALAEIADHLGSDYIIGLENDVFTYYENFDVKCKDDSNPWFYEADFAEVSLDVNALIVDGINPATMAMDEVITRIAAGEPVAAWINELQIGGHIPRCYFDPYTGACDDMWYEAVDVGSVDLKDDRESAWMAGLWPGAANAIGAAHADDIYVLNDLAWGTTLLSVDHFSSTVTQPRLESLLAALSDAGRLDDLVLVLVGDHGESPCAESKVGSGQRNCQHGGMPDEWLSNVPTFISPAALADDWAAAGLIGDIDNPWTTVNLVYGLVDSVGATRPAAWPIPEAPGFAASWTCRNDDVSGVRVGDGEALRCQANTCWATDWQAPLLPTHEPAEVLKLDIGVSSYGAPIGKYRNWFHEACEGP